MRDVADTIVDAKIQREALPPRADHRRTAFLVLIVAMTAAAATGVTLFLTLRTAPPSARVAPLPPPAMLAPVAEPAAPPQPAPAPEPAPPTPEAPVAEPAPPPEGPTLAPDRGEPSYRQKGLGRDNPPRVDRRPTD